MHAVSDLLSVLLNGADVLCEVARFIIDSVQHAHT